tara:strand:+ start:49 stop:645 length:597 start_codon:yes stop_codon:yes gene_type:complete
MIKELIKLSNTLDRKGLTKEADALDEIIKEASISERVSRFWNWVKPWSGPSYSAKRTAMAMVSLTPEERGALPESISASKDYEFSDKADPVDILKALQDLKQDSKKYSSKVDRVARDYMDKLMRRGKLTADLINSESNFWEGFINASPFGAITEGVKSLITEGVNAGAKAIGGHLNRIDKAYADNAKGTFTDRRRADW